MWCLSSVAEHRIRTHVSFVHQSHGAPLTHTTLSRLLTFLGISTNDQMWLSKVKIQKFFSICCLTTAQIKQACPLSLIFFYRLSNDCVEVLL